MKITFKPGRGYGGRRGFLAQKNSPQPLVDEYMYRSALSIGESQQLLFPNMLFILVRHSQQL